MYPKQPLTKAIEFKLSLLQIYLHKRNKITVSIFLLQRFEKVYRILKALDKVVDVTDS